MSEVSIKLTGMPELLGQLRALGDEFAAKELRRAARKAFLPVYETAHRLALPSMDTGALMDAIKLQVVKNSGDSVVAVGIRIIGKMARSINRARKLGHRNPARRWHFVEFGTVKMPAKPFLRPALDQNAELVTKILKEELIKGIQRAKNKRAKA